MEAGSGVGRTEPTVLMRRAVGAHGRDQRGLGGLGWELSLTLPSVF